MKSKVNTKKSNNEIPQEIVTDTKTRAVLLDPQIEATLPNIDLAFARADEAFVDNPEEYLARLQNSIFEFKSGTGAEVACSLIYGPESRQDELLVIFAPFSDSAPKSTAQELSEYITADFKGGIGGMITKEKVGPNSWNQTTKSAVIFELLEALGKGVPVLTIYSPIPTKAYSSSERDSIKQGDFSPSARLAEEAVAEAQVRLHGKTSETQIDKLRLGGASLGASNALGAGSGLLKKDYDVRSVYAQELIMGPESVPDLARRFTVGQYVGEAAEEKSPSSGKVIEEPALRKAIDRHGSELIGTNVRMVRGMKPTYMEGLTKPEKTVRAVENLLNHNVDVLVALAKNSALTHQTRNFLPYSGERVVSIVGNGDRIGHLADEHVALSALVAVLSIARRKSIQQNT
jgi:hypothetical protein